MAESDHTPAIRFCSYCGSVDEPVGDARVCGRCGLGVVLTTTPAALERSGEAFVVVTSELRVSAVSAAAAGILGRPDDLVGRPLAAALPSDGPLATAVRAAASAAAAPIARLELRGPDGTPLAVRVAHCDEPGAALVVLGRPRIR